MLHWTEDVLYWVQKPIVRTEFVNGRKILHSETHATLESDVEDLYFWHGVLIPSEWLTGKKPTATEALKWPNIEQRRCACEIIGWATILRELNARVVDQDSDPEIGTLLECDLPDAGKELFLQVRCATGRDFALCVTNSRAKTALEAQAWMFPVPAQFGKFIKPKITA